MPFIIFIGCFLGLAYLEQPQQSTQRNDGSLMPSPQKIETAEEKKGTNRVVYEFYRGSGGVEVWHGKRTTYRQDGSKSQENFFRDGLEQGEQLEWHQNGKIKYRSYSDMGIPVGTWTEWSESGAKQAETFWENGKPTRRRKFFTSEILRDEQAGVGRLLSETTYRDGVEAAYTRLYSSGQKAIEGEYDDKGKEHGMWTFFAKDGKMCAQGEWQHGIPWKGICLASDPKAIGSLQVKQFSRYEEGKAIEKNLRVCRDVYSLE